MATEEELRKYLKRTARELYDTKQRLRALEERAAEPIAIIGMACRFPGHIRSPEDLWQLVLQRREVVMGFPADRGWPPADAFDGETGPSTVGLGAFLEGAGEFDAGFFGITDREALAVDPQQRVLLEVAWEAIERSGIDPMTLRGTDTGVFVGCMDQGYWEWSREWDGYESYYVLGNTPSVVAGRVAYALGLEGPAVTVDTACSGSLVALHQAMLALRAGDCAIALAGGVTVMAQPRQLVVFSRQRAAAPDGRCKSYAAAADGTAWSEGAAVLALERLSDARRNRHRVLAVVRGSSVNADGASNGLTAPNGLSQQRVIRRALTTAGLPAAAVDAVEGHGTGTVLGDPIEAHALLATYGREHPPEQPVWLGSIKSNLGHTQSASGAAGVIKMVLAMRHGIVPATLHVDAPSPHVDWSAGQLRLVTEPQPWPQSGRPRRAAISSFGFSGTNAHVILEYDPETEDSADSRGVPPPDEAWPCLLSAKSAQALRDQAARLHETVAAQPNHRVVELGKALATTRAVFAHRAVVVVDTPAQLLAGTAALAQGRPHRSVAVGAVSSSRDGRVAAMFPGQGSQRVGLGRELYQRFSCFRSSVDELCECFDGWLDRPLRAVLFGAQDDAALLARTEFAQPALFTVEVAMFRLLESWGFQADFLIGHSIGELAAAHLAGVFSVADAAAVVAARGRLMQRLGPGAMVSIRAGYAEVAATLSDSVHDVSIAAVNGPNATVVSGDEDAVLALAKQWRAQGRRITRLPVDRAFHSPHVTDLLDEYRAVLARAELRRPTRTVISTVTGAPEDRMDTQDYWVDQVREPVLFYNAIRCLFDAGVDTLVEVGPGEVLSGMSYECGADGRAVSIPTLRAGEPEAAGLFRAMAAAWARGAPMDWAAVFAGSEARPVDLPTYAFQHRHYWRTGSHYWCDSGQRLHRIDAASPNQRAGEEPAVADSATRFRAEWSARDQVQRVEFTLDVVRTQLRDMMIDRSAEEIDSAAGILTAGLTSLTVLELRTRLNALAGTALALESFLADPTPQALAELICAELAGDPVTELASSRTAS